MVRGREDESPTIVPIELNIRSSQSYFRIGYYINSLDFLHEIVSIDDLSHRIDIP